MKRLYIVTLSVVCLSLVSIQCSRDNNPIGPELSADPQAGDAVISGTFTTSGTNSVDFSLIQVNIQGANIQVSPDSNGDFQINGVPSGNQSVEVIVESRLSSFDIIDIQSREEIRMQLQIQENNSVMLQHMYRNKKSSPELQLEIRPKKWNIDWENSADEGNARIYGTGFDTITSVVITGPTGTEIPVTRTEVGGVYYKAFFNQSDAIAAIPDPMRGDFHLITVAVTHAMGTEDLTYSIEIVGRKPDDPDEPEEELVMDINPKKWNTNWAKSDGYVTVRFKGEGFDGIVTGATVMSYMGGTPISPFTDSITGNSYMAKFYKRDAIALFTEPKKGDFFTVDVTVQLGGPTLTLSSTIEIVGPNK